MQVLWQQTGRQSEIEPPVNVYKKVLSVLVHSGRGASAEMLHVSEGIFGNDTGFEILTNDRRDPKWACQTELMIEPF